MLIVAAVAGAASGRLDHNFRPRARTAPVHLGRAGAGDVLLIVNTARTSRCRITPRFEGLEA